MKEITCICCPMGCSLQIDKANENYIITGNKCPRGKKYAIEEMTMPKRIVTSTVKLKGGLTQVVPVKTSGPIPKEKIFTIMNILSDIEVSAPASIGDIIIANIAETGVNIVCTKNIGK